MKKIFLITGGIIVAILLIFIFNVSFGNNKTANLISEDKEITTIIDKDQAILKVKAQSEVVKYAADLEKAGKNASFEAQDDNTEWTIQVFEIVKNDDGPSHTATFGWYRVNKKTGEIIRDL
jgi:hypothetical protein